MTTDLKMAVWSSLLCIGLTVPYMLGALGQVRIKALAGSREGFPALTGWIGRAQRAHLNMIENLAPFLGAVLAVHAAGLANPTTALAAQVFFSRGSRTLSSMSRASRSVPWRGWSA